MQVDEKTGIMMAFLNILRPEENGWHFADDIFKYVFYVLFYCNSIFQIYFLEGKQMYCDSNFTWFFPNGAVAYFRSGNGLVLNKQQNIA